MNGRETFGITLKFPEDLAVTEETGRNISSLFCSWVTAFQKTVTLRATSPGTGADKGCSPWKEVGLK